MIELLLIFACYIALIYALVVIAATRRRMRLTRERFREEIQRIDARLAALEATEEPPAKPRLLAPVDRSIKTLRRPS